MVTNRKEKEQRREEILAAALDRFAAKGLHATTITEIARTAGISQGLLYHYFRSKEELFTALIGDALVKMNQAASGLESLPVPPDEKIRIAIVELLKTLHEETFSRTVMLIAQANLSEGTPEEAKEVLRRESGEPYAVIARIMAAGQKEGSIFDQESPDVLSMLFWTTIKGLAMQRVTNRESFKVPHPESLLRLFIRR
ncbi:MAG: TetR/AcrR family transcriptional regulator [Magnetococcales bacterium]|nr:TetR/AcrR family transcriptional regulator [Magnetococcales bacterium]